MKEQRHVGLGGEKVDNLRELIVKNRTEQHDAGDTSKWGYIPRGHLACGGSDWQRHRGLRWIRILHIPKLLCPYVPVRVDVELRDINATVPAHDEREVVVLASGLPSWRPVGGGCHSPECFDDFEQFGCTDNCLGCADARAGR